MQFFLLQTLQKWKKYVSLQRVFHSIRFKVNKVGIQRYPFFYALTAYFYIGNIE